MTNLQIVLAVVAYLLFSASALVATVKYFTMPYWNNIFNQYEKGLDVSWCHYCYRLLKIQLILTPSVAE